MPENATVGLIGGFGTGTPKAPRKTTDDGTTGLQTTDYGTWKSEIGGQKTVTGIQ